METKAPSSIVSEISDNAKWPWRPEGRNTCETRSISIMALAGYCVGQHKILDNPNIVPPAHHVRREALRRLRIDRRNVHTNQPRATKSQALHGFRSQRPETCRPAQLIAPVHQLEKQSRGSAAEGGSDFLKTTKRRISTRRIHPCEATEIA